MVLLVKAEGVLLPLGTGFSAGHFLGVQSCEREKQKAGGPLVVVHAQKVCRQPQTGVPGQSTCILHQAGEMGQQELQEHNTHRDIKKMGPDPHRVHGWRSRGKKTGEIFSQCLTMRTVKHQLAAEAALHPLMC